MIRISVLLVFVLIELFNNEIKSQENNTQYTDEKYLVSNSTPILNSMKDTISNDINYGLVDKMISDPDTVLTLMDDRETIYLFKTNKNSRSTKYKININELNKNGYKIVSSKYEIQKIFFPKTRRYINILFNTIDITDKSNNNEWVIILYYSLSDNVWKYYMFNDITDPILP